MVITDIKKSGLQLQRKITMPNLQIQTKYWSKKHF